MTAVLSTSDNQFEQWLQGPDSPLDPKQINNWMIQGLELGLERLKLETGIISRIKNKTYTIVQVTSRIGDIFSPGDEFSLNDTYCEAVCRQHQTITYIQVGAIPKMRLHPVYASIQLESYIGSPLLDGDKVIGTVNFSSHQIRAQEFSPSEIDFIETMAERISSLAKQ